MNIGVATMPVYDGEEALNKVSRMVFSPMNWLSRGVG
jgi:hypothetical protein